MKKHGLTLVILILAAMIAREILKSPPQTKPSVFDEPAKLPAQQHKDPVPAKAAESTRPASPPAQSENPDLGKVIAIAPPSADGGRQKPPPNSIPFELVGGLVISFGDQLLGRPNAENFPNEGFIEAPKIGHWAGGIIPYSFDPRFTNPERVQRVLDYFNEYTPVRFVPFTDQKDSIVFSPGEVQLCLSYVGRIGGHQPIYLDDRCYEKEITHEIMHAIGFIHEHSRPDRDQFVRVNWDKIEEDKQSQFEAAPISMAKAHKGRPFDYQSVMIYNPSTFAKVRGDQTIESVTGAKIEPAASGLSPEDQARLIQLFAE
jgi:hypothetical protein